MKDLFCVLEDRLKPLKKCANINNIDLWNNQVKAQEQGNQKGFRYNSIFIHFIVNEVKNVGLGIKHKSITVRFYFAIKNLKSDKAKDLDFYDDFAQLIQGFGANEGFQPYFSSFHEVGLVYDNDHDNIALPFVDYNTIYIDLTGYRYKTHQPIPDNTTPAVTVDIVEEIQ